MLARLLTIAVLMVIGYFTVKSHWGAPRRPARRPDLDPASADEAEDMVVCAECGAYVSEQAALRKAEAEKKLYFCNETCRRTWQEKP